MRARTRVLAREFFRRTRGQPMFNVNDFREHRLHESLPSLNAIGGFFSSLSSDGYIEKVTYSRVEHRAGKKRWIWSWRWTKLAEEEFGESG